MEPVKNQINKIKTSVQAWCNFKALESSVANMSYSQLVNLPTELLREIFEYTTVCDKSNAISIMILRATCQRFRCFFDDPLATIEPAAKSVMQQRYSYFLRSRHLYSLIRSETKGRLVCIACMRLLPAKLFFSTPVKVPSHKRLCKGHEGELDFFRPGYGSQTWEKLHAGGLQYWNPVRDYWWPSEPSQQYRGSPVEWYHSLRNMRRELGPTDNAQKGVFFGPASVHNHYYGRMNDNQLPIEATDFLLRREWVLCEAPRMDDKTASAVGSKVDSVLSRIMDGKQIEYIKMCPHMCGRNVASKSQVRKLLRFKTVHCPIRSCKTWLRIEQQTIALHDKDVRLSTESAKPQREKANETSSTGKAKEWLVLVVVRNVGSMKDPTDPRWISQLDVPQWPGPSRTNYCPPLWLIAQSGYTT
ncbi:uncharacterized protein CC84DRAFT_1181586 [Paraphaeosphaeria sporulosa]|uniref:F-box domain-containing protein n=1 Tax=Paraphaeosphaeria sporulosa TaxID=1460663 RepID=A0A177BXR4_9PLEO|nr:uncharacterized protein CC84DRAFT_1181586 [Paraphaeosphaeria sporulosa]OAF99478.1 hypothetical protein CC84DRAFT_1181586 [Paraphaeosphaeria sporulosa]